MVDTQKCEAGSVGFDDEEVCLDVWVGIYVSCRLSYPSLFAMVLNHSRRTFLLPSPFLPFLYWCFIGHWVICASFFTSHLIGAEILVCFRPEEGTDNKSERISQLHKDCVLLLMHTIALAVERKSLASKYFRLFGRNTAIY